MNSVTKTTTVNKIDQNKEWSERKRSCSNAKYNPKRDLRTKKPIRISINLVEDSDSHYILPTDHTCKNEGKKATERTTSNDYASNSHKKSGLNHFNILSTKYQKIEEKLKRLSKDISLNESLPVRGKKNGTSVKKKHKNHNNLSIVNANFNQTVKPYVSKFNKKNCDNVERLRLNFSLENKDHYGVLTPKVNKNSQLRKAKDLGLLSVEKPKKQKKSDNLVVVNQDSRGNSSDSKSLISKYKNVLYPFELEEMTKLGDLYFLGKIPQRQQSDNAMIITCQEEFTDENGNYIVNIGDHLNYRYEILSELGTGSFGQALKCYDHKDKLVCCLKVIKNSTDFISQAELEIKILNYIKRAQAEDKHTIVEYYENFVFRNHICIKFELLDLNLYEYIRDREFVGMDECAIRKITKQVLYAMNYMKRHNLIHCDLKPENILFKSVDRMEVKVIDFGSSCFTFEKMFTYIQSRFYRAPEVILEAEYNTEIDMWSLGCIVAEMFNGYPIFPGESEVDQFNYFLQYLGVPPLEIIDKGNKKSLLFYDDYTPICAENSKGKVREPNTKSFYDFLAGASKNLIDFVKLCLNWDREKRLKPEEALLHPWILESLPKKESKAKVKVERKKKPDPKKFSNKSVKTSNFVSYQKQMNKILLTESNKNGATTKNTSINTEKYSSPIHN